MKRLHIQHGSLRSTVSISDILYDLVALKHNTQPQADDSHRIVRTVIQKLIDKNADRYQTQLSQWVNQALLLHLVKPQLNNDYWTWQKEQSDTQYREAQKEFDEIQDG